MKAILNCAYCASKKARINKQALTKEEVRKLLSSLVFEEDEKRRWEIVSKLIKESLGE